MKQELEIEFKSKIDYEEHLKLRDFFPFEPPYLQENVYYDTKDRDLFEKGIMCRVRKFDDKQLFTIKEPCVEGIMEYEFSLVNDDIYQSDQAQTLFEQFDVNIQDIEKVAFSNTVRYEHKDAYGTWCLDVTQFENHKDYEIEYELYHPEPEAENHFYQALEAMEITYTPIVPKYVRALHSSPEMASKDVFQTEDSSKQ